MKNYVSFLVSIFAAFILWLAVNFNGEYEDDFKAEIVIKNLSSEKAIKSDYPDFVNIRLKGQGWKLLPFYFFSRPQVIVDMSNVQRSLNAKLSANHHIRFSIPKNVQVIAVDPETLNIELDRNIGRKVPIFLQYEIEKDNYSFSYPPKIYPDSVLISGAESIVSKIDSVLTEKISVKMAGEYKTKLKLLNPNKKLVKLSDETVDVLLYIDQIVEREFTISVQVEGLPSDKEVILFPPDVRVVIRGALSRLIEINNSNKDALIKAFVNYRDVLNDKTGLVKPQIITPENLKLVSVSPEGLEYIIRQK